MAVLQRVAMLTESSSAICIVNALEADQSGCSNCGLTLGFENF
jgi:hypothetical protein